MSETTQMETQNVQTTNNLSLSDVPYDDKYRLNQAAATQLVRGMQEMASRLNEPGNDYQKELYPALKTIVGQVVENYSKLFEATSDVEREVYRFNLHGYSGKVKRAIATRGVKFNLVYKYANFGDYLKTITQRLTYLAERPLPQRYVTNASEGTAYELLRGRVQTFLKFIKDDVEQSWNTAVSNARTVGGLSVQENLRKRTERMATRKTRQTDHENSRGPRGRARLNAPTHQPYERTESNSKTHNTARGEFRGRGRGRANPRMVRKSEK